MAALVGGERLETGTVLRVFKDLAPLCRRCAHRQAPELAAIPGGGTGASLD